jgi:predicted lipoprotein with Yx(FWY)xxD motif
MAGIHRPAAPGFSSSQAGGRPRRVLRRGTAVSGLAAAALLAAACGSAGGSTASPGGGNTGNSGNVAAANGGVSSRQLSGIGTVLVDSSGRTIYTPKTPAEASGKIHCTGSCLGFWFPVTASSAHLAASGLPGKLATIRRADDGKTQLTYNGRPLYTFRLDTAAGQAHGSNFSDMFGDTSFTWQAVTASGQAAGAAAPASSASTSTGSGSGY